MKRGKKTSQEVKIYLTIIENLRNHSISEIAKSMNWSRQRLNPYIQVLKQAKVIEKKGYGTWVQLKEFNHKDVKKSSRVAILNQYSLTPNKVRGHGFQFKLILPGNLKNWDKREEILKKLNL